MKYIKLNGCRFSKDDLVKLSNVSKKRLSKYEDGLREEIAKLESEMQELKENLKALKQKEEDRPSNASIRQSKKNLARLDFLIESNLSWSDAAVNAGVKNITSDVHMSIMEALREMGVSYSDLEKVQYISELINGER